MKGIILAGGAGSRLHPITKVISKQLLPVYNKPMIYYPLAVLLLSGIREILIISTPQDTPKFKELFGDGSQLGLKIFYEVQPKPEGLAQAFIIGEEFIGKDSVTMILGDNIFYGHGLPEILINSIKDVENNGGGIVFGYYVKDPERYGVVSFDEKGKVININYWDENGKQLVIEGTGIVEKYYPSGQIESIMSYRNSVFDGKCETWFPNGIKASETFYEKGKPVGIWRYWNEYGNLIKKENY